MHEGETVVFDRRDAGIEGQTWRQSLAKEANLLLFIIDPVELTFKVLCCRKSFRAFSQQ